MTAPFVTSLRNPIAPHWVELAAQSALTTPKRGIRGGQGTLWERVAESGAVPTGGTE